MKRNGMGRFQRMLLENKKIAERNAARLDKDVRAACERITKKTGRSVLIVAVDKGGSSIFGQEYCTTGFTAASEGSLEEVDAVLEQMCARVREELGKIN